MTYTSKCSVVLGTIGFRGAREKIGEVDCGELRSNANVLERTRDVLELYLRAMGKENFERLYTRNGE